MENGALFWYQNNHRAGKTAIPPLYRVCQITWIGYSRYPMKSWFLDCLRTAGGVASTMKFERYRELVGHFVLELVIVFVGVTAAFALEGMRQRFAATLLRRQSAHAAHSGSNENTSNMNDKTISSTPIRQIN